MSKVSINTHNQRYTGKEGYDKPADFYEEKLRRHQEAELLDHPDGSVTEQKLADGSVSTRNLKAGAVTSDKLSDNFKLSGDKLEDDSVNTNHLMKHSVTSEKIGELEVQGGNIANEAISSIKIAPAAVKTDHIDTDQVTWDKIAPYTLKERNYGDGSVSIRAIQSGAITTEKIAAGAVTKEKLAADSVGREQIDSLAIMAKHITPGAIDEDALADEAVTSEKIASGAVTTAEIASGAVTSDKLASGAVDGKHISPRVIKTGHIAVGAVEDDNLADSAVTEDKVASGVITTDKIAAGAVTKEKLAANSVGREQIDSLAIMAKHITPGAIDEDALADEAVTSEKIADGVIDVSKLSDELIERYENLFDADTVTATMNKTKQTINGLESDGVYSFNMFVDVRTSGAVKITPIQIAENHYTIDGSQIVDGIITINFEATQDYSAFMFMKGSSLPPLYVPYGIKGYINNNLTSVVSFNSKYGSDKVTTPPNYRGTYFFLQPNRPLKIILEDAAEFHLPELPTDEFAQILVQVVVREGGEIVDWGTTHFFHNEVPYIEVGRYNFIWEHDDGIWYAGAAPKGEGESV